MHQHAALRTMTNADERLRDSATAAAGRAGSRSLAKRYLVFSALVSLATGSCGGGSSSGAQRPAAGSEGGPCLPSGACRVGLTCASNLCVLLGAGSGGTAGSGEGGSQGGVPAGAGAGGSQGGVPAVTYDPNRVVCTDHKLSDGRSSCSCARTGGLTSDPPTSCDTTRFGGAACISNSLGCYCEQYGCGETLAMGGPKQSECWCRSTIFAQDLPSCPPGYAHFCYDGSLHTCVARQGPCDANQEELPSCDASVVVPKISASFTGDCYAYINSIPPPPPPPPPTSGGAPNGGATGTGGADTGCASGCPGDCSGDSVVCCPTCKQSGSSSYCGQICCDLSGNCH